MNNIKTISSLMIIGLNVPLYESSHNFFFKNLAYLLLGIGKGLTQPSLVPIWLTIKHKVLIYEYEIFTNNINTKHTKCSRG